MGCSEKNLKCVDPMLDFLPQNIKSAVFAVGEDNLREIRIRANRKIIVVYYSDGEIIKKK